MKTTPAWLRGPQLHLSLPQDFPGSGCCTDFFLTVCEVLIDEGGISTESQDLRAGMELAGHLIPPDHLKNWQSEA